MHAVGIDIGGTKISGALVDDQGNILTQLRAPSPINSSSKMIDSISSLIESLTQGEKIVGVGVAAAGFLSADRETMYYSPNIAAWNNEPLRAKLQSSVSKPVLLENDANAAGWAEFRFGAGKDVQSMIMLTIGTGVGGAIISEGRLIRGGFGIGAELGHVTVVPGGKACGCGLEGCLESYGSGTALVAAAKELADSADPAGARLRQLKTESGAIGGDQVYQAILEQDPGALVLIEQVGSFLGRAIGAIFVPVIDPELVVIGGGVSVLGDKLLNPIRDSYQKAVAAKTYWPQLRMEQAKFLNEAGLIGAADLARQAFA